MIRLGVWSAAAGAAAVLVPAGLLISAEAATRAAGPTAAESAKIAAAARAKPYAQPKRPRRVLIVPGGDRFAAEALAVLGRRSGAYRPQVSADAAHLQRERIGRLDVVCFAGAPGGLDGPGAGARRRALLDWVRAGGGFVVIGAAVDAPADWGGYSEMLGARCDGWPWDETVTLKNDDPDHPVNAAFGGKGCRLKARICQLRQPYSRERLRVLMSLDVARTRMNKVDPETKKSLIHRADADFAVSWVRRRGKGRVFCCVLGGRRRTWWNEMVVGHVLAGIQFAAGDLEADTTPSAELHKGTHPPPDAADFVRLFNGKDLSGWTCKAGSWAAENGVLVRKGGGNIWTRGEYADFVLDLEFKLARGTNSGVFLRCGEVARWQQTALEIQLYDSYAKSRANTHDCGAVFDCLAPRTNAVRAPGYWNRMTVTARGPRLHVVLNRKLVLDTDLSRWTRAGKNPDGTANKYDKPLAELPRTGRIGLQDHGRAVWFRNLRIKKLQQPPPDGPDLRQTPRERARFSSKKSGGQASWR